MKKVIVVVGPTAIGKTKISIELAKFFNLDIISADSVSVYKELNIGSAKPTFLEREGIVHHLIDVKNPDEDYSVFDFQKEARSIIDNSNLSLICGGTGLYVQSVLFDYNFEAQKRDANFEKKYENLNNEELYELLIKKDKNIINTNIHMNNRKRVLRALEILEETNSSITEFNNKKVPLYDYFIIYLNLDNRDKLYERINMRVDLMFHDGLLKEVKNLFDKKIYPNAIGYKELIPYFEGKISLDEAKDEIKKNTRHLAKRQITWFKNQFNTNFYNVNLNDINETINKIILDVKEFVKK